MKNIFITGSRGFLGSNLVKCLKISIKDIFVYEFSGNICSISDIESELMGHDWDIVIHLAGISHNPECEQNPQKAYEVNTMGTLNLCEALGNIGFSGVLYFSSTAQVYAADSSQNEIIFNSQSKVKPQGVYAKSKFYAEAILEQFSKISDIKICVLRLFNHTHKSQDIRFFLPSMVQQIINEPEGGVIKVGNIDIRRDFSLVSDFTNFFVEFAFSSNAELNSFQILNLSSGISRNLRDLLNILIRKSGKHLKIQIDPKLTRKYDPVLIASNFEFSYVSRLSDEEFIEKFLGD